METLHNLETLDVSNNAVTSVDHACGLPRLKDLWLNDNSLEDLESLLVSLSGLKETLTCVYLGNNPAASELVSTAFKQRLRSTLPFLEQLDSESLT